MLDVKLRSLQLKKRLFPQTVPQFPGDRPAGEPRGRALPRGPRLVHGCAVPQRKADRGRHNHFDLYAKQSACRGLRQQRGYVHSHGVPILQRPELSRPRLSFATAYLCWFSAADAYLSRPIARSAPQLGSCVGGHADPAGRTAAGRACPSHGGCLSGSAAPTLQRWPETPAQRARAGAAHAMMCAGWGVAAVVADPLARRAKEESWCLDSLSLSPLLPATPAAVGITWQVWLQFQPKNCNRGAHSKRPSCSSICVAPS